MTQQFRTDLAVERTAAAPDLPGITQETRGKAFSVTEIRIKNDVCGAHWQACRTLCYIRGSRHIPEQRRL